MYMFAGSFLAREMTTLQSWSYLFLKHEVSRPLMCLQELSNIMPLSWLGLLIYQLNISHIFTLVFNLFQIDHAVAMVHN